MKYIAAVCIAGFLIFTDVALAATALTSNVRVKRVDASRSAGEIKIQTDPRPNISSLGCSSDFWLVLEYDPNVPSSLFDEMYAAIILAKANNTYVSIEADDNNSTPQFCDLSRIILE